MSYDYETTDHLGRTVEVTEGVFLTRRSTLLGGGDRSTQTSLYHF